MLILYYNLVDYALNTSGIIVNFPTGDVCNPITNERYQASMKFICDSSLPLGVFSPIYSTFNFDIRNCKSSIEILTANGIINIKFFLIKYFL